MWVIDQPYVYVVKSIHSNKCTCALVKKSSVHVQSYLMLMLLVYDNKPNNANILNAGNRLTACLCGEKYP